MLINTPRRLIAATIAKQIDSIVVVMRRSDASTSTRAGSRMVTKAAAVASIAAIQGTCSLISMANEWSHAVPGFARSSERG